MNRNDFVQAIQTARKGNSFVYHRGLLMQDRELDENVDKTARAAWALYAAGKCTLVQRRIADAYPSACAYIAVRL